MSDDLASALHCDLIFLARQLDNGESKMEPELAETEAGATATAYLLDVCDTRIRWLVDSSSGPVLRVEYEDSGDVAVDYSDRQERASLVLPHRKTVQR